MSNKIKLTKNDLKNIVLESVIKILNETHTDTIDMEKEMGRRLMVVASSKYGEEVEDGIRVFGYFFPEFKSNSVTVNGEPIESIFLFEDKLIRGESNCIVIETPSKGILFNHLDQSIKEQICGIIIKRVKLTM
jgi:hypothetical protein